MEGVRLQSALSFVFIRLLPSTFCPRCRVHIILSYSVATLFAPVKYQTPDSRAAERRACPVSSLNSQEVKPVNNNWPTTRLTSVECSPSRFALQHVHPPKRSPCPTRLIISITFHSQRPTPIKQLAALCTSTL